jgi:hypothetical protein
MLQNDFRIGGDPRYILTNSPEPLMAIPDEVRKCVCFVGYRIASGEICLAGTAFWLSRLLDGTDRRFIYLVTARHVIDHIKGLGLDSVLLRLNSKSGSAFWVECKMADWHFHPDASIDVALLRVAIPSGADHLSIGLEMAATNEVMAREKIGIGDEVFVTGLFTHHYGDTNNIPIVRVGNIAAMTGAKVKSKNGPIDAYLIESRSIGGLSGSPVFVNLGLVRHGAFSSTGNPIFYWMGLIHGHFDVDESRVDSNGDIVDDGVKESRVNTGIAVVIPFEKVMETIGQPSIKVIEEGISEQAKKETYPVPDEMHNK